MDKTPATQDEWYRWVLDAAGLASPAPVEGCSIFKDYSLAIWDHITSWLRARLDEKGFRQAYFPLLIPAADMRKVAAHYEGFEEELLPVKEGSLFIRPTSEMVIYPAIRSWVRSRADLPLKVNQFCSVVRWEGRKPNLPLVRDNEFLWQESHSLHATAGEAREMMRDMLEIYRELIEDVLAVPVVQGNKPPHRLFPGAVETLALEAIMPNLKSMQLATSHFLGQAFSRPLDLSYPVPGGKEPVWQSCHGVTTRLIGAMVMVHGDSQGLVIPPPVAPVQVAVEGPDAEGVAGELRAHHLRARADVPDPVLRGVPLVVRGPPGSRTITRRDTLQARPVAEQDLLPVVRDLLKEVHHALKDRAAKVRGLAVRPRDFSHFIEVAKGSSGYLDAPWCGGVACAREIKQAAGASLRVSSPAGGSCIRCGSPATARAIFAPAY